LIDRIARAPAAGHWNKHTGEFAANGAVLGCLRPQQ
jgi:hypothetical protein